MGSYIGIYSSPGMGYLYVQTFGLELFSGTYCSSEIGVTFLSSILNVAILLESGDHIVDSGRSGFIPRRSSVTVSLKKSEST